jgi:hypothetical protein
MFLILSGEGSTDIGINTEEVGPMTKLIDNWIVKHFSYSFIRKGSYIIIPKNELTKEAKKISPSSRKGKYADYETGEFFKRARALAKIADRMRQDIDNEIPIVIILFADTDSAVSSKKVKWATRYKSVLDGFDRESVTTGIPMVPAPISEAWILCALKNKYKHCGKIEDESGSKNSPDSLKKQLEKHLCEPETRVLLNNKIDDGEIDIDRIIDMPSLTAFKDRLSEVLKACYPVMEDDR